MYLAVAGACAEQKANAGLDPNAFTLSRMVAKYITGSDPNGLGTPVGRNFDFVSNNSSWMTGIRVYGDDMYISNRGNNNLLDSNNVLIHKIDITNTDGVPDQQLNLGTTYQSIDSFDLDPTGTKLLIGVFHGTGGARSGTLATAFDLTSTFSFNGSLQSGSVSAGVRAVSWGNNGNKYFLGYDNIVRQYTASTAYVVASSDTQGTSNTLWAGTADLLSDITFNLDGTKMFVSQHTGYLKEYALSTAWDSSTATLTTTMDIRGFFGVEGVSPSRPKINTTTTPWVCGLHWSQDGEKLYIKSLWGMTDTTAVQGVPSPPTVTGSNDAGNGTEPNRFNTFPVIEMTIDPVP